MRHLDESHDKQPGCMWGLFHVLDYHHWQRKYEDRTQDKLSTADQSPEPDASEAEKLLVEKESPYLSTKRYRGTKKRSLKAGIKALIAEEITRESEDRRGKKVFSFKPRLQRTYSIHHLESVDDDDIGKIRTDWKHPIIFVPGNVDSSATQSFDATQMKADSNQEDPDVLDIFKVDKVLLMKHVQDGDERVANFSRITLGLKEKAKFSKSRSFPLSDRRKVKPVKLENKSKEIWSFPHRENKSQTVNRAPRLDRLGYFGTRSGELADDESNNGMLSQDTTIRDYKQGNNTNGKHIHTRSSLNVSLDKYAQLFENSFRMDAKLNTSKSLKLTNEYGHAPVYFRRIRSLSNVDSFYYNQNFEVLSDGPSGNGSVLIVEGSSSGLRHSEEEKVSSLLTSDKENVRPDANMKIREKDDNDCGKEEDGLKEEAKKLKKSDSLWEKNSYCSDISPNELPDQAFVWDLDTSSLQETESLAVEHQISEGLEHRSSIHESNFSIDPNDLKSLHRKSLSLENDEISTQIIKCLKTNNSELHYVKHLLDRSGIALDASEMMWHSSDQPFGPQLFEKVEACWPHEQDQLDVWPDFHGCWHHQMLFDLVNEVLVEVYDLSLPYYPKALSSSFRVRPFPVGNRIIEDVCASVSTLLNLKPQEKESLETIVARDLAHDYSWMNLQLETESVALDLQDMIFNELLEEVVFSCAFRGPLFAPLL